MSGQRDTYLLIEADFKANRYAVSSERYERFYWPVSWENLGSVRMREPKALTTEITR